MKSLKLIVLFLLITGNIYSQEDIEKNALFHAKQMEKYYNSGNNQKYVDYILPSHYGNDSINKKRFTDMWQKIMESDTSDTEIIKILKFSIYKDQYQALFQNRYHNSDGYVFGISTDKGENWFFSSFLSNKLQFGTVLRIIPSIDTSFASIVDPRFGKRISYEIGKAITPFEYKDIEDNLFLSDSLKGHVIVLNFWSITCGPCIIEIPELNKLVEDMKGKNIVFIAPAIYTPKERLLNDFLLKHPFLYNIVLINADDYRISGFPTHILINKKLKVAEIINGYNPDSIKKMEETINKLLKE